MTSEREQNADCTNTII